MITLNDVVGNPLYTIPKADTVRDALLVLRQAKSSLKFVSLYGQDLQNIYLSHMDLTGADLRKANLSGANFISAKLDQAYLNRSDLTGAFFNDASLRFANFSDANLRGARLRRSDLFNASLSGCDVLDADFTGANLSRTNLECLQSVFQINGSLYQINAIDDDVRVGCMRMPLSQWLQEADRIGSSKGLTSAYIAEFKLHLNHLKALLDLRNST